MFGHITRDGLASLALRLGLAVIFLYHGVLHVKYDPAKWHSSLPAAVQVTVSFGELVCGAAMLFGFFSRIAALGIIAIMIGAAITEFPRLGFAELDIDSEKAGLTAFGTIVPGIEFNIALIAMAIAVLLVGSGPMSLDYRLSRRPAPAGTPAPATA